ncbi:MAG: methionyl-tRNA formyltransferase [Dehalococcoidia bacterium]
MRVAVIGQAAFGEAVLKRLLEDDHQVVGVSAPAPASPARPDALWAAAEAASVPTIDTRALKEAGGLDQWRALGADLAVMAFVTEILPGELFDIPTKGTIQYHPSLLPLHRGSSAMNWPIIFGRDETGLTIFWPDEGIDTGPVLLQERCPIDPDDTVVSLYFNKLFPMGVEAMAKAVRLVEAGEAPRIPQDHAIATYEPPCRDEHARIPWHAPAEWIYALIRGCNSQPGAWTTFKAKKVRIFDCRLSTQQEPGLPGCVLRVDDEGLDVRLNGGVLRVLRVQPEDQPKLSAAEWAATIKLEPGSRFR